MNTKESKASKENAMVEGARGKRAGRKILFYTKDVLETIVPAALAAFLLFYVVFRVVVVEGNSMNPTLQNGDIMVVHCLLYTPKVGDIVVCTSDGFEGGNLVKRIIGVPGDTLEFDFENGIVRRNGVALDENYIAEKTKTSLGCPQTVRVGVDAYFVMGDNRNNSNDSRNPKIGLIHGDDILGGVCVHFHGISN